MSNYELNIISHHEQSNNKALRKYYVEGIDTIGVFGNESFEIQFKNNTYNKCQVKLSIDGTDIQTGEIASTDPSGKMWVVEGNSTLKLTAYPETNKGGASFVFTDANNSVSKYIHGDMSCRGIIASAVFTEGNVPQSITYIPSVVHHYSWYPQVWPTWVGGGNYYYTYNPTLGSMCSSSLSNQLTQTNSFNSTSDKPLSSLPGVGAGDWTEQNIVNAVGLVKPFLTETIQVKYLWWDDLVAKLLTQSSPQRQVDGFPGDQLKAGINLKNTPRLKTNIKPAAQQQVFARF